MLFGEIHVPPLAKLVVSESSGYPDGLNHVDVYQRGKTVWIDTYQLPGGGLDVPHLFKIHVEKPITQDDVSIIWTDGETLDPQQDPHNQFVEHITITSQGKVVFEHDEPIADRLKNSHW